MTPFTRVATVSLIAVVVVSLAGPALAQESKSATLAKQLTAALDAGKLDCIAAKDPSAPDIFMAALYFSGAQLLVISGKYSVPQLLTDRLAKKEDVTLSKAIREGLKLYFEDARDWIEERQGERTRAA